MSKETNKKRAPSARDRRPSYARPTRASLTRMTGADVCPRKTCGCSETRSLTSKPMPPKARPVTSATMLGRYPHDRAGRTARGRGYRPGQIGMQAGKVPSQLLQKRIRQLARDIKDKHINQINEGTEASADSPPEEKAEQQVTVAITNPERQTSQSHQLEPPTSYVNLAGKFRARKEQRIRTTSENSQTVWENDESEDRSNKDKVSKTETESRPIDEGDSAGLSDNETAITNKPSPPTSPPPTAQHKTRRVAVLEPLTIESTASESDRPIEESGSKRPEPVVPLIIPPKQEPQPSLPRQRPDSSERNKERTEPDSSSGSTTDKEGIVPLIVEYPSDLPARYRSQIPLINESPPPSNTGSDPLGDHRTRKLSESHSENYDLPRTRWKSRRPSLSPTGAPLLGWSPAADAGRGRSNSVINISSAYMARRNSVFGVGLNVGQRKDSLGTMSLSSASLQPRRASVADIFKRSRLSRSRRLSTYLQNTDAGKERALERLKRISKTVKIIAGICLALKSYVKTAETKQWSLIEMHLNLRADMEKTLAFDPIMFSKLRVTRGSEKLRSILSSKSSERTTEDIDVVLALLRKNKTFADYDQETQTALAKVMEYLRYEPRRIILKEGHQASGFYIILSGTCLVNQKEIDPRNNEPFVRTIDELHTGDSFGDNELLNDCVREVSVICKEECEVLLVNKEDFSVIIREPLEKERDRLLNYCSRQSVFEKPPTHFDFRGNNYAISAKKYKPGVVITSDISKSDFIYVVQSGKCRVISEVKEIKGRPLKAKNVSVKPLSDEEWKKDATLKRTLTVFETMGNRRRCLSEPKLSQLERQNTFFSLSGIKESTAMVRGSPPYLHRTAKRVTFPEIEKRDRWHRKSMDFVDRDDETEVPPALPKSLFAEKDHLQTKPNVEEPADKSGLLTTWRRVSIAARAANEKHKRRNPLLYLNPNRLKSTYAEVAVLKEGDVFGVETLVTSYQSDTRLSLVSEGADCIVVSKKFFATHATVRTIQQSTKKAIEYPSAEYTLDKIRQARAWSSYKESLVKDVCNRKTSKAGELSR